jgi:multiple sugar transport system substrate-binding protein
MWKRYRTTPNLSYHGKMLSSVVIKKRRISKLPILSTLRSYNRRFSEILIIPLCLMLILSGVISGCAPAPKGHRTPVRVSFWGSANELLVLNRLIAEFETSHPAIDIVPMHVPQDYFQKLHIWMAAGLAPDVMMMNNLMMPVYANAGQLADLTPYTEPKKAVDVADFYPQALQALSRQQALYAIPRDLSILVVFYNRSLLRMVGQPDPQPDWSWPEAIVAGQAVTRRPVAGRVGVVKRFGWSFYKSPPLFWLPFVWSWGGQWFDDPSHVANWHDGKAMAGLRAYVDLRHTSQVAPSTTELGNAPPAQLFLQGRLAFLISGRWSVPFLREFASFDWDVVPFPAGPAGSRVGIDASGYSLSAHSPHKAQAWEVLAFFSSAHAQSQLSQSGLIIPARRSVAQALLAGEAQQPGVRPRHARVFLEALASGVPTQTSPDWNEVSEQLTQTLTPWFETGQLPPDLAAIGQAVESNGPPLAR